MTDESFERFRDRMVLGILVLAAGTLATAFIVDLTRPASSTKKFEIVDSYNGCDVIRYTTPSNDWEYFLDCSPKGSKQ